MTCAECNNKICLENEEPCREIEKQMRKEKIYLSKYIRSQLSSKKDRVKWGRLREVPFSNLRKEDKRRVEKKLGRGYWSY